MIHNLPDELWLDIFDMAVEDADLFEPTLPTTFSDAAWFKILYGDWFLRSAQENVNNAQRRSYATKKAIMATCRNWRRLGYEFHYRFLFFSNPHNLQRVCALMDHNKDLGRWTRRLHITRYSAPPGSSMEVTENSLISVMSHCPKLETFIINWPLSISFSPIANALCNYCPRTLRVLQINIPSASLAKLIHLLERLPNLMALQAEFDGAPPEELYLGSAADIELTLSSLQHLALRGPSQDFIEEAIGWRFPSLKVLSLDFVNYREDLPDIIEFLTEHGESLTFLDLNCIPALDVPTILELCPLLTTFTFNPDWRIPGWNSQPFRDTFIVRQPHAHITTIGLHHLMYAFGVGYAASHIVNPNVTKSVRRQNDLNFSALHKRNFPHLQRIRLLNTTLLADLEKNNGPGQDCFERWERWSKQCQREGVRLEDCTGAPLGTLPEYPEDDAYTDSGVTDEGDGDGTGTNPGQFTTTLRQLLLECRQMNAQLELDALSPAIRMVYAGTSSS